MLAARNSPCFLSHHYRGLNAFIFQLVEVSEFEVSSYSVIFFILWQLCFCRPTTYSITSEDIIYLLYIIEANSSL